MSTHWGDGGAQSPLCHVHVDLLGTGRGPQLRLERDAVVRVL